MGAVFERGDIGIGEAGRRIGSPGRQKTGFAIGCTVQTKFGQLTDIVGGPSGLEFLKLWEIQHRIRPVEPTAQCSLPEIEPGMSRSERLRAGWPVLMNR